jgi:hypothetical protein
MLMGGLTGSIRYCGPLTEFLPLLRFCERPTWASRPLSVWENIPYRGKP